jgi:hypothetical protein
MVVSAKLGDAAISNHADAGGHPQARKILLR